MRLQPEMQPGPLSAPAAKTAGTGKPAPSTKQPHPAAGGSRRKAAPQAGSQSGPGQPHRGLSERAGPAPPQERNHAHKILKRLPVAGARGRCRGATLRSRLAALPPINVQRCWPCAGHAGNRSSGKGAPVMAAALAGVASTCPRSVRRLLSFVETERPEGCSVFLPPVNVSASPEAGALRCTLVL